MMTMLAADMESWALRHSAAAALALRPATDADLSAPRPVMTGGLEYGAPPELVAAEAGLFHKELQCLRPVDRKDRTNRYNEASVGQLCPTFPTENLLEDTDEATHP